MLIWKVRLPQIPGKNYLQLYQQAHDFYKLIKKKSKRKAYIKSKYFKNQKVLFYYFWDHLRQKRYSDRVRRLKLFICAVDLIEKTTYKPQVIINPQNKSELLYRFFGESLDKQKFVVQLKGKKGSKNKQFISLFPVDSFKLIKIK